MGLTLDALPDGALLLVDSAPIIYVLESHRQFAARFEPVFQRHAAGRLRLAVTTVTLVEVMTGPLRAGEEALARRYRAALESWQVVDLTADIAESAARLRAQYGLKLPDAVQLASALAINAAALVTHDRDFSKVRGIPILG
ncbi:MAG: PIN domain-containing protein [Xanthomonadales bacterium]|jgi:predicted nucleic acid-binding protein|nr:PIN domain-containing protein [Xanthomonadales bacterium]